MCPCSVYSHAILDFNDSEQHCLFLNVKPKPARLAIYQSVPIISYASTTPTATKIFNYKKVLYDIKIDEFKSKPPDCTCASSPFIYNPTGRVITGNII